MCVRALLNGTNQWIYYTVLIGHSAVGYTQIPMQTPTSIIKINGLK